MRGVLLTLLCLVAICYAGPGLATPPVVVLNPLFRTLDVSLPAVTPTDTDDIPADPANRPQAMRLEPGTAFGVRDFPALWSPRSTALWLPTARDPNPIPQIASGSVVATLNGRDIDPAQVYLFGLSHRGGDCNEGFDPNYSTARSIGATTSTITFVIPTDPNVNCRFGGRPVLCWNDQSLELETLYDQNDDPQFFGHTSGQGRKICIATIGTVGLVPPPLIAEDAHIFGRPLGGLLVGFFRKWTGLNVKVAFNCDIPTGDAARQCSTIPFGSLVDAKGLTPLELIVINPAIRTRCCKSRIGLGVGVCTTPNVERCCSFHIDPTTDDQIGIPYSTANEKCCGRRHIVVATDEACPCRSEAESPTLGVAAGFNADCPPEAQRCCLPTKYPELIHNPNPADLATNFDVWGGCYNETVTSVRCCNSGDLYDPGSHRCCSINGLQSRDHLCPCATDADCTGGTLFVTPSSSRCCKSQLPDHPDPWEYERCDKYANFYQNPIETLSQSYGEGELAHQRCFGRCIDTRYQICCNGSPCLRWYEKCCNTTCCSRYSGTCEEGRRPGARGSEFNTNNLRVTFYQCTTIEFLTVLHAGLVFIIPLILLMATLGGLGIVLVFANKASNRTYSFLETAMIVLATLSIFAAIPLYFSPMFKYGIFIVLASLVTILSAAARIRGLNIIALVAQFIILMYIFDPIHGNQYLTFTAFPHITGPNAGLPDTNTKGLFHTTTYMFDVEHGTRWCTTFYDYFRLDPALRDVERYDNPYIDTFGYCKRGWVAFLLYFEALLIVFFLVLFIVTLLALVLRFRKTVDIAPVELEVQKVGYGYGY